VSKSLKMHRRLRDALVFPSPTAAAGIVTATATGARATFATSGPRDDEKDGRDATGDDGDTSRFQKNMDGAPLRRCGTDPMTGFYRDGFCHTGTSDRGNHLACIEVNERFLEFTKEAGNDLSTPHPPMFPGLVPGDRWCLCAARWMEAAQAGAAPPLVRDATHELMALFMAQSKAA
jgi:uncharacterized protein